MLFYAFFPKDVTPNQDTTVTIKGKNTRNAFEITIPLKSPIITGNHVHQLAAKSLIRVTSSTQTRTYGCLQELENSKKKDSSDELFQKSIRDFIETSTDNLLKSTSEDNAILELSLK